MTPEEMMKVVDEDILSKIHTWDDAYEFFGNVMAILHAMPSTVLALDAAYLQYAFLLAMKEAPEEGDITVLMRNTFENMFLHGETKLGVKFTMMSDAEAFMDNVAEAAGMMQVLDSSEQQENTEKPVLH